VENLENLCQAHLQVILFRQLVEMTVTRLGNFLIKLSYHTRSHQAVEDRGSESRGREGVYKRAFLLHTHDVCVCACMTEGREREAGGVRYNTVRIYLPLSVMHVCANL
jgi:hypothetical protein